MTISTQAVTATVSGTSWSVDVTNCNLSDDLTEKDFVVIQITDAAVINNSDITKDSATQISYSGSDVGTDIEIQVNRFTEAERYQDITFGALLSSSVYNEEIDNILRMLYELQIGNEAATNIQSTPLNEAYGPSWSTDTTKARTAKVIYDEMEKKADSDAVQTALDDKADLVSPNFSGTATVPTAPNVTDSNQIASTEFVQNVVQAAKEALFPVGSIYTNATDDTNPATLLGFGTWEAFGEGRVLVGLDASDSDFDTAEETGGEKEHELTEAEMQHKHRLPMGFDQNALYGWGTGTYRPVFGEQVQASVTRITAPVDESTGVAVIGLSDLTSKSLAGNVTQAHNNLQPYITVYMWKRTA